ncbi:component of SufBCD complex [Ruegeria pomeroyi]|uniref:Component of SufBCD complex n=1 Tax=Ruegeria alba TaxID=2916756 RepID=A0ABS9NSG7_9RHOB|nr:component of SufBCD complex [Ruegeria alba]MCE8511685.1 component of SufBCD complex [Ruegeria pomeroyi]MCE8518877.1 component of SufBCD complex [Ruegeria pomeroyi]MCE8520115.1 component of SufBCD complex [Ruegeria pomeroyi]MCE8523757.1 component of SufBCD complex [Ruegeria pomeroyi]MCE8527644.1 component of SufBCD complex [Ruegeria pomeroyi]
MDWYSSIFELIDMRSFSNLWFWIALAVVWSSASHWVLGVPYDMVTRARRVGGQAAQDLDDIARVNVNRMLYIVDTAGLWIFAFCCFTLSALAMLGFFYGMEFAQAVFLLAFPMSLVALLNLSTARRVRGLALTGEDLARAIGRCRIYTQVIGMVSIFFTSLWGMYQNLSIGVLG